MMNTFKIPDSLESKYKGAGYALAAVANGHVVDLKYIADLDEKIGDALSDDGSQNHANWLIKQWLNTPQAGQIVRELQALGDVSIGMCSSWEFCEL